MRQQILVSNRLANGDVIRRLPGLVKDNTATTSASCLGSEGTLAVVTRRPTEARAALTQRTVALLCGADLAAALEVVATVRSSLPSLGAAEAFFHEGVELVCATRRWRTVRRGRGLLRPRRSASRRDESADSRSALGCRRSWIRRWPATRRRARLWPTANVHTERIIAEGIPHSSMSRCPCLACGIRTTRPAAIEAVHRCAAGALRARRRWQPARHILGLEPDDERADDAVLGSLPNLAEHQRRTRLGIASPLARTYPSPADIASMRAIKRALDPQGILNPGVLLPAE